MKINQLRLSATGKNRKETRNSELFQAQQRSSSPARNGAFFLPEKRHPKADGKMQLPRLQSLIAAGQRQKSQRHPVEERGAITAISLFEPAEHLAQNRLFFFATFFFWRRKRKK